MTTIEGVELDIGPEAVVVTSATPLTVLSSAIAGGGLGRARVIMNLHVEKNRPWEDAEVGLAAFAARRRLPAPWVGLLTAAATDRARVAIERVGDLAALVVASVGLSNRVAAGWSAPAATGPGTINTIAVVVASTGRGRVVHFGGPISEAGWVVARAARMALAEGVGRWQEEHQ